MFHTTKIIIPCLFSKSQDRFIAKKIKNEILIKNFNMYFEILEKSNQEPFKNKSWRKAQTLYNSIDENNKENLKDFVQMVMIESITTLLAHIDGVATFSEQKHLFELFYENKKVNGDLSEYLLMDIEDKGFF